MERDRLRKRPQGQWKGFMNAKDAARSWASPLRSLYLYVQQGFSLRLNWVANRLFRRHDLLHALHASKTASRQEILG